MMSTRRLRIRRPKPYQFQSYEDGDAIDRRAIARAGARGTAATLAGTWARFVFQATAMIVLAHVLLPAEFGVFAMVSAISGLGELIRDLGLSFALVQAPTLTARQASTLFWYSTAMGGAFAIVLTACTPLLSSFYHESRVSHIVPVLAGGVIISSLGSVHIALLDRALGFTRVMLSDVLSSSIACVAAIIVAAVGGGYWALVVMLTGQVVLRSILAWTNVRWVPGVPGKHSEVRRMVSFGWTLFIAQVLNYTGRNVDNVIVGRIFGPVTLGQYAQAYQLLLLPLQQINAPLQRVAIPLLSRTIANAEIYRQYFRMAIRLMTLILIPMFAVSAILSDGLVRLLLGPGWEQSAGIFRILCVAGMTQSLGYAAGWLFVSSGAGGRQLRWALISRPLVIASFFVGAGWGVKGVATCYAVVSVALVLPTFAYAMRTTPARMSDLLSGLRDLAVIAPVVCAVATAGLTLMNSTGQHGNVIFVVVLMAVVISYIMLWILLPGCRATARRLGSLVRGRAPAVPAPALS